METTITGNFAFIKAWKADTRGNLIYRKTARNFNQDMATAGKIVVAEVILTRFFMDFLGRRNC